MSQPVFKLNPDPTFSAFVRLTVPGNAIPARISVTFRHKTAEGVDEWYRGNVDNKASDALHEVIAGWGEPAQNDDGEEEPGIAPIGADGEKLPYTREALVTVLANYPASASELVRGYLLALKESRVKN